MDWRQEIDHLRCTPSFFNKGARYDGVVFHDGKGGHQFGKLRMVFISQVAKVSYPVALVEVLDIAHNSSARPALDHDLGLCRLRSRRKNDEPSRLIPAEWIIRGALIVKDHGCEMGDEYFVVDVVDSDMFLRCKEYVPYWYS